MNLNTELLQQAKEAAAFEGYTPTKYEIASIYLESLTGIERISLIDQLAPFKSGKTTISRIKAATSIIAKNI